MGPRLAKTQLTAQICVRTIPFGHFEWAILSVSDGFKLAPPEPAPAVPPEKAFAYRSEKVICDPAEGAGVQAR